MKTYPALKYPLPLYILLSVLLSGCQEECGITAEPTLSIRFYPETKRPIFTKIKALGMAKEIPLEGVESSSRYGGYGDLALPLNLNQNYTTYIFEQADRVDTLTIFYQKTIYVASKRCGSVLDLERPTTGKQVISTFRDAYVIYSTYYSIVKSIGYNGGGGISITIYP